MTCEFKPEAFKGVELSLHLAAVGAGVYVLFRERLSKAGLVARPLLEATKSLGGNPLIIAAVLAGSLHDVGKASPYYAAINSFSGHEIVGAMIVYDAALSLYREGRRGLALITELAAWAIARHHSAMEDRHPASIGMSRRGSRAQSFVNNARRALEELRRSPECLVEGLPEVLRDTWIADSLTRVLLGLSTGDVVNRLNYLINYEGSIASKFNVPRRSWAAYVSIASGAVIVADILVAGAEGRETDEGGGPAYVEWWRRELGESSKVVEELARNPVKAGEVLREALSPLL